MHIWLANLRKDLTCCCSEDQQCNFKLDLFITGLIHFSLKKGRANQLIQLYEQNITLFWSRRQRVELYIRPLWLHGSSPKWTGQPPWPYVLDPSAHLQTFPQHYSSHGRLAHFWDTLAISQAYLFTSIFSTSKGKLRRYKQMVFDQKQWSCAIDFFKNNISQNHRMLEVGRDLWWSSGPMLLLKQHHLKPLVLLLEITFLMPSPKVCQPKDILITETFTVIKLLHTSPLIQEN